LFILDCREYC